MPLSRIFGLVLLMLSESFLSACSSQPQTSARDAADANDTGGRLSPNGDGERALLRQLPKLPSGPAQRVGDFTVLAEPPYQAASGQTCRALHVTRSNAPGQSQRLACSDGTAWFFVPDVFGGKGAE